MSETKDAVTIDFGKMDGLVPGIVQDAKTGEMLMLGFPERGQATRRRWRAGT